MPDSAITKDRDYQLTVKYANSSERAWMRDAWLKLRPEKHPVFLAQQGNQAVTTPQKEKHLRGNQPTKQMRGTANTQIPDKHQEQTACFRHTTSSSQQQEATKRHLPTFRPRPGTHNEEQEEPTRIITLAPPSSSSGSSSCCSVIKNTSSNPSLCMLRIRGCPRPQLWWLWRKR